MDSMILTRWERGFCREVGDYSGLNDYNALRNRRPTTFRPL